MSEQTPTQCSHCVHWHFGAGNCCLCDLTRPVDLDDPLVYVMSNIKQLADKYHKLGEEVKVDAAQRSLYKAADGVVLLLDVLMTAVKECMAVLSSTNVLGATADSFKTLDPRVTAIFAERVGDYNQANQTMAHYVAFLAELFVALEKVYLSYPRREGANE